ncbi:hypothetical protein GVX81_04325 [[Haemophilus] felis]|nr:hypothetical protein [[Haemophilus] felis]
MLVFLCVAVTPADVANMPNNHGELAIALLPISEETKNGKKSTSLR